MMGAWLARQTLAAQPRQVLVQKARGGMGRNLLDSPGCSAKPSLASVLAMWLTPLPEGPGPGTS